ncbi:MULTISPECIES: hypothetical protein [unclassified Mycobacterium]|uniref:hypothetical protein n=1 Tax=unclassified Mycobacterium TaxID=2642494 RepID=UPI002741BE12|nr:MULTISPECIES: hypothetical protein [unclassified Mycobacterium]MDP7704673.1 hypothetical protein [Mycobacterium sp. TY815]MDP7723273.1 hypothetical protein [Mycobacterium sp. TY814]
MSTFGGMVAAPAVESTWLSFRRGRLGVVCRYPRALRHRRPLKLEDGKMAEVPREWLGSIELADLTALFVLQGHENPPYPFMSSAPDAASLASVSHRFSDGDLSVFRTWVKAYQDADIWLECRLLHNRDDIPDIRILAYRADQSGFFASQRPHEDVVDVYQLSPYDLGPAVAASIGSTGPGSRGRIVIPKYENYFGGPSPDDEDDYEVSVMRPVRDSRGSSEGAEFGRGGVGNDSISLPARKVVGGRLGQPVPCLGAYQR